MKAGTAENVTSHSSQGSKGTARQEPFARVAPVLRAALLLGVCGGFTLATILTLSYALALPLGSWWAALAQAHGHLQLYGWAGLFVLGITLHFLPRLRGTPLAAPALVPWLLGAQVVSLCLRAVSQPALVITGALPWRVLLIGSGVLEVIALGGAIALLGLTFLHGPALATRPAFKSTLLLMAGACCALALAGISNLVNMAQAAMSSGLVNQAGDDLNVTIGLFGFLVSMALAMSVRSLPMYAGLEAFPGGIIRPLSTLYLLGVTLLCLGTLPLAWGAWLEGAGMCLEGGTLLLFICAFLLLMRTRGRLPQRVGRLAPHPQTLAQSYRRQVSHESRTYGPFVTLVGSAYLWAALGSVLLIVNGISLWLHGSPAVSMDAIRHCLTLGFIALLICGIAPRMLPGFSGGRIASAKLVHATLWLGNIAAFLRVATLLLPALIPTSGTAEQAFTTFAFGLSGPAGLALATCLLVNLWPALRQENTGSISIAR
jgi:uncharacterized protein involved in response to NO